MSSTPEKRKQEEAPPEDNKKQKSNEEVSCVLINVDGKSSEIKLDPNDKKRVMDLLGGTFGLGGLFVPVNVTVLINKAQDGEENAVKLPPPLHEEKLKGKILLVKTDDQADYVDLTLDEWEEYVKADHSKELKLYEEGEDVEGDEFNSEEEDDDEDEDEGFAEEDEDEDDEDE